MFDSRVSKVAATRVAVDHGTFHAVPVAQHSGRIAGARVGQSTADVGGGLRLAVLTASEMVTDPVRCGEGFQRLRIAGAVGTKAEVCADDDVAGAELICDHVATKSSGDRAARSALNGTS